MRGSYDHENWETIWTGSFVDPSEHSKCDKPLLSQAVDQRTFRYLEFIAVNSYGSGPALQFFGTDERKDNFNHLKHEGCSFNFFLVPAAFSDFGDFGECLDTCPPVKTRNRTCLYGQTGCIGELNWRM